MKVVIPVGALHVGGGCRVLAQVANALAAKGHEVEVVIPNGAPLAYDLHCQVTWVPALQQAYIPSGDIVLPNFYTTFAPAYAAWPHACVRLSLGFEPDWVPDPEVALWTYAQGVPMISISHWLDDKIYSAVGQRTRVVNLGIDHHVFHPKGAKHHKRHKVILYIARDPNEGYALKGYDDFVQGIHRLQEIHAGKFVVHLICPERPLPLPDVTHRVFQPTSDAQLAHLYRHADVFVSTSWFEGFALPPLEAMSCGTPVVTTNSGGVLDYCVHKKSAYIVRPRNPDQLAHAMKRMLSSRHLKHKLITQGLSAARAHTTGRFERRIVRALEAIYAERRRLISSN